MPMPVVKSAVRAIKILEMFASARSPLRLNDIRLGLGFPQSSTTALLKSLVGEGYLNYDRVSRTYFPTTRVGELGDWIFKHIYHDGRLVEFMSALGRDIGETVVLVAQNDVYAHCIYAINSEKDQASHVSSGYMRPLPRSSAGLTLLSRMDDARADRLCRSINIRETDQAKRLDLSQVAADIVRVRHLGYAFLRGTSQQNEAMATVSMPLPAGMHAIPLAVSICGPKDRVMPQTGSIVAALKDAIVRL